MTDIVRDTLEMLLDEVTALGSSLYRAGRRVKGLSPTARSALLRLAGEPLTVPQLARQRGVSRQSMQVLVDRLAGAGLVEYAANPDHQRSERVVMTAAGREALGLANRRHAAWLAGLLPLTNEPALHAAIAQLREIRAQLQGSPLQPARTPVRTPARPRPRSRQTPIAPSNQGDIEPAAPEIGSLESLPVNLL